MMKHFFISDVHLFPEPEEQSGRDVFVGFLHHLHSSEQPGALWILGDLFDYWFEYRSVIPSGHHRTLAALRMLSDSGWKLCFLPGNHDFWVGRGFQMATGASIISDNPFETTIGGKRVLLTHGDGLGPGDLGYKIMKPILRSPVSRFLFRLVHPDLASRLARGFSDTSRRILRKDMDSIPDGLRKWMTERIRDGADIVITGHTHLDAVQLQDSGMIVSLGDWLTRFTYCVIGDDSGEPELLSYSINEGELIPREKSGQDD